MRGFCRCSGSSSSSFGPATKLMAMSGACRVKHSVSRMHQVALIEWNLCLMSLLLSSIATRKPLMQQLCGCKKWGMMALVAELWRRFSPVKQIWVVISQLQSHWTLDHSTILCVLYPHSPAAQSACSSALAHQKKGHQDSRVARGAPWVTLGWGQNWAEHLNNLEARPAGPYRFREQWRMPGGFIQWLCIFI